MKLASMAFAASAAFAASFASTSSLAGNMSLTIEGIAGSIEVLQFNFGAKNPASVGGAGGGAGSGKVTFSDFAFTATESAAGPALFDYVSAGKHSPGARFAVLDPNTGKPQSEWVLTDVIVSAFGVQNGDLDPKAKQPNTFAIPTTAFGLAFAKACYRVFAGDGSVAKEACWNVVANTSS